MNYRLLIGLLLVLLVVAGCSRKTAPSITSEVSDSSSVKYVPRIVEVKIPGDTVTIEHYIQCDSVTNKPKPVKFKVKNKRAKVSVSIDEKGKLTASGGCDSLREKIQLMDKEIFRLRTEKREEIKPVIEYRTYGIDIFCRWFTGIILLITVGYVGYKFKTFI